MPALVALSCSRRSKSSACTYGCNSCVEIFTKRYTRVDGAESGFPKVSDLPTGRGHVTVRSLFVVYELGRRAYRYPARRKKDIWRTDGKRRKGRGDGCRVRNGRTLDFLRFPRSCYVPFLVSTCSCTHARARSTVH